MKEAKTPEGQEGARTHGQEGRELEAWMGTWKQKVMIETISLKDSSPTDRLGEGEAGGRRRRQAPPSSTSPLGGLAVESRVKDRDKDKDRKKTKTKTWQEVEENRGQMCESSRSPALAAVAIERG